MMKLAFGLYAACFAVAATISFCLTPLVRLLSLRMGLLDAPSSPVKTHTTPTPIFGGVAIWAGFAGAMMLLRFTTNFPNGTLYNLRALLFGGTLVFLLGLADDLRRPEGLGYKPKFVIQFLATALLVVYGLRIHFIHPTWLAVAVTLVWVVGVTNSMNIIDIMDGLEPGRGGRDGVPARVAAFAGELREVRRRRGRGRRGRLPAVEPLEAA
jgi:UDP-GlcNAc:undecaprenyl-phosphate GlcNAc-1-phosphate transferase